MTPLCEVFRGWPGADEAMFSFAVIPFQGGEVGERARGDRGDGEVEHRNRLDHGEPGGLRPVPGQRCVPRGALGVGQGPQEILRGPGLPLHGDQQFTGPRPDRGQLQAPEPGLEVRCQHRARRDQPAGTSLRPAKKGITAKSR